ncbi:hypothetical protein INR49_027761 [Caranx melampygus]|nr:hypothetical protein INR49_027761 [Caranx melampygus]
MATFFGEVCRLILGLWKKTTRTSTKTKKMNKSAESWRKRGRFVCTGALKSQNH